MKSSLPNILAIFMPNFIPSSRPTSYHVLHMICLETSINSARLTDLRQAHFSGQLQSLCFDFFIPSCSCLTAILENGGGDGFPSRPVTTPREKMAAARGCRSTPPGKNGGEKCKARVRPHSKKWRRPWAAPALALALAPAQRVLRPI